MPFIVTLKIPTMADLANIPEEFVTSIKLEGFAGGGGERWQEETEVVIQTGKPKRYIQEIHNFLADHTGHSFTYGALKAKLMESYNLTDKIATTMRTEMKNAGCVVLDA